MSSARGEGECPDVDATRATVQATVASSHRWTTVGFGDPHIPPSALGLFFPLFPGAGRDEPSTGARLCPNPGISLVDRESRLIVQSAKDPDGEADLYVVSTRNMI